MKLWIKTLKEMGACDDALKWAEQFDTKEEAWQACERGDRMLWVMGKLSGEPGSEKRKKLVLAVCECARLAPQGDARLQALETAEAWARGENNVTLDDVRAAAYAASAAAAVAGALNMNLVEVSAALEGYEAGPGRGRLIRGIKGSYVIDDTYNASPESMRAGLELLQKIPGKRKIAVLGDMLEIGKYTEEAHRVVGDQAAAYSQDGLIRDGIFSDTVGGAPITITRKPTGEVSVMREDTGEEIIPERGFWFSWAAFYPETKLDGE